ncbi:MAG: large repetitive protein [Solirubrobacteraceae bacterium]|nr:large repetitive protein [Solirubrobacteraceae bacterium]
MTPRPRHISRAVLGAATALLLIPAAAGATNCTDCDDPGGGGGGGNGGPAFTKFDGGPGSGTITTNPSPSFSFHSTQSGSTFTCKVDTGNWYNCISPEIVNSPLSDGDHTFSVRATAGGVTDPNYPSRTFAVDTQAPAIWWNSAPAPGWRLSDTTPTWKIGVLDPHPDKLECEVDNGGWNACGATFTPSPLSDGSHTISARAIDAVGHVSQTLKSTVIIDTTAPVVSINNPPTTTNDPTPTFSFSAPHDGGIAYTFDCRVPSGVWTNCSGGTSSGSFTAPAQVDGAHAFDVYAVDGAGNVSAEAEASFVVDTLGPVVAITSGPADGSEVLPGSQSFAFTGEPGALYECSLDGAGWSACVSPYTTGALTDGAHDVAVRGTDALGNLGAADKRAFAVKSPPPPPQPTPTPDPTSTATPGPTTTPTPVATGTPAPTTTPTVTPTKPGGQKKAKHTKKHRKHHKRRHHKRHHRKGHHHKRHRGGR